MAAYGGEVLGNLRRAGASPGPGAAGVSSFVSGSLARSEMALNAAKTRLSLRAGCSNQRSFRFSDTVGPDGHASGLVSPRMLSHSVAAVPGSPRSPSPSLRGLPAGKLMESVRTEGMSGRLSLDGSVKSLSMAWPHRRGTDDSLTTSRHRLKGSRSISPPRSRILGRTVSGSNWLAGTSSLLAFSDDGNAPATQIDPAEAKKQELIHLATSVASAAEQKAQVDVLCLNGVGPNGCTRALSPRVRQSHWIDGLSPRRAERGGARLFPCHLATPHVQSSSSRGSTRTVGSPPIPEVKERTSTVPATQPSGQESAGGRSPRTSKAAASTAGPTEGTAAARRRSPKASVKRTETGANVPTWAAPRRAEAKTATPPIAFAETQVAKPIVTTLDETAKTVHQAFEASAKEVVSKLGTGAVSSSASTASGSLHSNTSRISSSNSSQGDAPITQLSPPLEPVPVDVSTAVRSSDVTLAGLGGASNTRAASRLSQLRSKLESTLRAAEQGLQSDLQFLDERFSSTRRNVPADGSAS